MFRQSSSHPFDGENRSATAPLVLNSIKTRNCLLVFDAIIFFRLLSFSYWSDSSWFFNFVFFCTGNENETSYKDMGSETWAQRHGLKDMGSEEPHARIAERPCRKNNKKCRVVALISNWNLDPSIIWYGAKNLISTK